VPVVEAEAVLEAVGAEEAGVEAPVVVGVVLGAEVAAPVAVAEEPAAAAVVQAMQSLQ